MFDWLGLVYFVNKTLSVSCHTADSKPVKQGVNGSVILSPLVFPGRVIVIKSVDVIKGVKTFVASFLRLTAIFPILYTICSVLYREKNLILVYWNLSGLQNV